MKQVKKFEVVIVSSYRYPVTGNWKPVTMI